MESEFRGCWRAEQLGRLTGLLREVAGSQRTWLSSQTSAYRARHVTRERVQSNLEAGRGGSQECVSFLLRSTAYRNGNRGNARSPGRSWEGPGCPGPTHTLSCGDTLGVCA